MEIKITKENAGELACQFLRDEKHYSIDGDEVLKDVQIHRGIGKILIIK
jgi:hypothetical protein